MSLVARELKMQDTNDSPRSATKCRIPQRLPTWKSRPISKSKPGSDAAGRPRSANRLKDDSSSRASTMWQTRQEKERHPLKRPAMILKKAMNDSKPGKQIITVPLTAPQKHKYYSVPYSSVLPDQETIQKREDLELENSLFEVTLSPGGEESPGSGDDSMTQTVYWQRLILQFKEKRKELEERQRALMELYATMKGVHEQMTESGEIVILPPSEDLNIINVAKLTPDQLLQLCTMRQNDATQKDKVSIGIEGSTSLVIDMRRMNGLLSKLIATCEKTLSKRNEIINWIITLKSEPKSISIQSLERKINEFKTENQTLRISLENAKGDAVKDLDELIDSIRKIGNEAAALQLHTEEQTYEITELHSQISDLQKQLHNSEILKSNKTKTEELEKELKEEKCKRNVLRDRLSRAEREINVGSDRIKQLETALDQSHLDSLNLERTVQQLKNQNESMQAEFNRELDKLTSSIRDNTVHLEEIAEAREKLQAEKVDLEKHIGDLSEYYNESLSAMKHNMNINVAKLIEAEKKYEEELEEKKSLIFKVESLSKQSREYEKWNKELLTQLKEKEKQLDKTMDCEKELQSTQNGLKTAHNDIKDYKTRLEKQNDTIKQLKHDLEVSLRSEDSLQSSLKNKEELITELENKKLLLEEQLQQSENKMISYEQQLASLKDHIKQLQEDFGQFESLPELHDMINKQRANLLEVTRQNGELAEALQKKDIELEQNLENLAEQEHLLEQKEVRIKMLSDKEIEQSNIIKLLRTNLEMRTKGEMDLSQQIMEKNSEIQALISNLDTRKKQICQLEKIILTLEEQTRKSCLHRKKDQDKICLLEKQIAKTNNYHLNNKRIEEPSNNIDNIIKIFEDELGTSFEPQLNPGSDEYLILKNKLITDKIGNAHNFQYNELSNNPTRYQTEFESAPTKIVMGNFVKKTYFSNNDDKFKADNLELKKPIINIDTQKWMIADPVLKKYVSPEIIKDRTYPFCERTAAKTCMNNNPFLSKNVPLLNMNQVRDEKRCKMFRFAGHRL